MVFREYLIIFPKRWSDSDESIIGIEPGIGAAVIVVMFKQFIE